MRTIGSVWGEATDKVAQPLLWLLIGAAVSGAVFFLINMPSDGGVTVIAPSSTQAGPIQAYVTGAVVSPGIYTLQPGSRVNDLVQAAGGALPEADMTSVNLAKRVSDEDHVYVSSIGEAPATEAAPTAFAEAPPATVAQAPPAASGSDLIDINRASAKELMALPGIGEVRSRAIVDYRAEIGGFQRIDQILDVPGIGIGTFNDVRELVTVET